MLWVVFFVCFGFLHLEHVCYNLYLIAWLVLFRRPSGPVCRVQQVSCCLSKQSGVGFLLLSPFTVWSGSAALKAILMHTRAWYRTDHTEQIQQTPKDITLASIRRKCFGWYVSYRPYHVPGPLIILLFSHLCILIFRLKVCRQHRLKYSGQLGSKCISQSWWMGTILTVPPTGFVREEWSCVKCLSFTKGWMQKFVRSACFCSLTCEK